MKLIRGLMAAAVGGLIMANPLQAQGARGAISGRVVDSTSQLPMQSVTVTIEGTQRGAVTRIDGGFNLNDLPAGTARLRVTRIGYSPQSRDVAVVPGQTVNVRFSLQSVAANLGAVVVTGYGSQRKEAVTGSVVTINADDANVGVIVNATQLLTARAPGVSVIVNGGEPGAGAQIKIRGGTSLSGGNDPLYVVDGVPLQNDESQARGIGVGGSAGIGRNPLNAINPADIASLTVLKDAAATAIYGSRGANGVVLIETKKGRAGTATMEYETSVAANVAANSLNFLDGNEYRAFIQREVTAGRLPASRLASQGTANTNWENALRRTGITQTHNLAFAGGNQTTTFRASLNFQDQQGVVIANGMSRLGARINGSHEALNGKLRIGVNLASARVADDYLQAQNTGGFEGDVFSNQAVFNPTRPVTVTNNGITSFFEEGTGRQGVRNPVALARQVQDEGSTIRTIANVTSSLQLLPSVSVQLNVGSDRSNGQRNIYLPRNNPVGFEFGGRAVQTQKALSNENLQALVTWSPTVGNGIGFDIVGGYDFQDFDNTDFAAEAQGFTTDAFGFTNLGGGSNPRPPSSFRAENRVVSFFSRANMSYKDRYFVTGVLRRDGSSRFGDNNKWAVFPAISGAWLISDESFAKGLPFSQLKLRVGYGLQGNQAVPAYGSLATLAADQGARYVFGTTTVTGITPNVNPNPDLKWERTAQSNIAFDYGFKDGKYSGTFELYDKRTTDLLLTVPIAQTGSSFVGDQLQNIGSLQNRGFEASFDANIYDRPNRGFTLTTGLVLSVERNKVLNLGPSQFINTGGVSGQGQSGVNAQRIIPGQPIGTFYGAEFVGFSSTGAQEYNKYTVVRDPISGRETSRSITGRTSSPGGDDFMIIGNAQPSFSLGLRSNSTWRGFDASWLWRAEQGRDVFNNTALVSAAKSNVTQDRNFLRSALDDPTSVIEPAQYSSRWIENGSFLRLQNVTVGYSFKVPGTSGKTARVFLSGDNLLLFTPYSGYDPEVFIDAGFGLPAPGMDWLTYPRARTFMTGMRIQF